MRHRQTLSSEKKRDILDVFNVTLKRMKSSNRNILIAEVISEAYYAPAPRFYVGKRSAQNGVCNMLKGNVPRWHSKQSLAMYEELTERYVKAMEGKKLFPVRGSVILDIVESTAPSFYVSQKTFRKLVYESLNEMRG